ncbi:MAG: DNA mismatch repair endonuclease MutL [Leptospiraceae bacterium]|nr:DNA mismatch repair endonuclease MutL [Leptospiraceae bacterium]
MESALKKSRIRPLPSLLIDRIAAGEVIDGPSSVVKELAENALDAGATEIIVETSGGGIHWIAVEDNGAGIAAEDLHLAIQKHATSKIETLDDINEVLSYGFRGEALSSIAAISYLEIVTKHLDQDRGARLVSRGGEAGDVEPAAREKGTRIYVEDLFYSTPARKKFLKAEKSENQKIHREFIKLAMARLDVSFTLIRDEKTILSLLAGQSFQERAASIFTANLAKHLLPVSAHAAGISVSGFISDHDFFRASRDRQYSWINGRPVEFKNLSFLVKKGYGEIIPHGSHPAFFLFLEVEPDRVDVNVHPAKREVRLLDESLLHGLIQKAVVPVIFPDEPLPFSSSRGQAYPTGGFSDKSSVHSGGDLSADPGEMNRYDRGGQDPGQQGYRPHSGYLQNVDSLFVNERHIGEGRSYEVRELPAAPEGNELINRAQEGEGPYKGSRPRASGSFLPVRHFGVIFGTYILAEAEDGFYIIDQHTAHERINYELKRKALEERSFATQNLLTPLILDYSKEEARMVKEHSRELEAAGFQIDEIGEDQLALRRVPDFLDPGSEIETIMHVVQRLAEGESMVRVYDEYAAMKACKASIKKNDVVHGSVLSEILRQLSQCQDPSRCPHGRPTMIRLSRSELDRMFHRS